MHIKRWLVLLVLGITFVSLGVAYLMTQVYRTQPFPEFVGVLTLQFIGRAERGVLFIGFGVGIAAVALLQLSRSILAPFRTDGQGSVIDIIYDHRMQAQWPRIVAIGGGTGLSTLLRGLKEHPCNLTAIVSVADDGGSSGRLRDELGIPPPGDIRQCLVALADAEPQMTQLFQYRFTRGEGLEGHSFGNLFIAAMLGTNGGDFVRSIQASSRILAVRGEVLPATTEHVILSAEFDDGSVVRGETAIRHAGKRIRQLHLQPASQGTSSGWQPAAVEAASRAILNADMIVIGPGSLYTSVMPNLLVDEIATAVRESRAVKAYVCNVATEYGETEEFRVADHVRALERHLGQGLFQHVVVNSNLGVPLPEDFRSRLVAFDGDVGLQASYSIVLADVIDPQEPRRHSAEKLAAELLRLYYDSGRQESARRDEVDRGVAAAGARTGA